MNWLSNRWERFVQYVNIIVPEEQTVRIINTRDGPPPAPVKIPECSDQPPAVEKQQLFEQEVAAENHPVMTTFAMALGNSAYSTKPSRMTSPTRSMTRLIARKTGNSIFNFP